MKKNNKVHNKLLNLTLIALFAAICYISLSLFFFPFAQMYIHFGNLIVVVAALLIGGWQGGLAGSIGMGLYDILNGHIDSSPKTFILKFLIGLTVGIVFCYFKNRKKYPTIALLISAIASLLISIGLLTYSLTVNNGYNGKSAVLFPLFLLISVLCFVFAALKAKLSQKYAAATAGAVCGMLVNIVGETLWKTIQFYLAGSSITAALSGALIAQGSTLINAAISIIGGVALFSALEKPFLRILKNRG